MHARLLILLAMAMFVGCADRDTRTTQRTTTQRTTTDTSNDTSAPTGTTGGPSTSADRSTPGASGPVSSDTNTAMQRSAARPVIEDPNPQLDPANTGVNKRDADADLSKTPGDQGQTETEVDTTAAIRKRVTDMDLSTNAENVKIITQDGKVTLRGPVESDEEKQTIERIAKEVAGEGNVTSELQVEKK